MLFWAVSGVLALGAAAGSREEAAERALPSLTVDPTLAQPILGERLEFDGRWIGIPVGRGWIEVKEVVELEGRRAYHIELQGHSNEILSAFYPVHDVIHSYLDAETLRPVRFEKHQREGRYRAEEIVTFDHTTRQASYQSLVNGSTKTIALPGEMQDLISAFYWFRAQPLVQEQTLAVSLYTDEKIYDTQIIVNRPILLELLKRGTFPCVVVEPRASFKGLLVKRGRLWAYLTTDRYRLPLLVKATTPWGPMSAVLDEASIPKDVKRWNP